MIKNLDDYRPHMVIPRLDGVVSVMPRSVIEDIVNGKLKITDVDDWDIITRTIFQEWLSHYDPATQKRRTLNRLRKGPCGLPTSTSIRN